MTALVVDDDPMNRELLRRMLVRLGFSVDDAEDGRQAIEACGALRYDLVLLDLLMPGLNGAVVAGAIRSAYAERGHAPCVLAVTGSLCDGDEAAVFDGVLPKPFVLEELSASIADGLASRDRRSAGRGPASRTA